MVINSLCSLLLSCLCYSVIHKYFVYSETEKNRYILMPVSYTHLDGRMKYEIKIVYNAIKYEFDIDAATGKILEWESESIYD